MTAGARVREPRATALDRARELLADPAAAASANSTTPATSTCSTPPLESTGVTQDLMLSRLVPAIYERYWRPALGRVAKGLTGPGMAEELRIARLLLGLGEGDFVLDLACGPGNFSREFARAVGAGGPGRRHRRLGDDARARRRASCGPRRQPATWS